jgi:protein-S-isoprenylcysteine O-methyltransferase
VSGPAAGSLAVPALAGLLVAAAIVVAARTVSAEVLALAAVGAVSFADLARRGVSQRGTGRDDPTDVWMSVAFAGVLVAGAFDVGRGTLSALPPAAGWALRVVGAAGILGGVELRRRARRAMGENFLVRLGVREGHTLVAAGPYRRIRHPTYTALLLVAVGTAIALGSPAALLVTVAAWLPIVLVRIRREEGLLVEEFGDAYRDYRSRTWRLFPGY